MLSCVYVEAGIRQHPRTEKLLARLRHLPLVEIEHYGEVFNPRAQNFRLQKKNPALIIAAKNKGHILATPEGYGLGGENNYYFSHMLNCVYDCRYCFLQGMFQSAHQLLFVNYEEFADGIDAVARQHAGQPVWFYSGYDCDSLAYDPMTGFADYFIPRIESIENAWMELRTKSTQIRSMLKHQPCSRIVTAFSFTDSYSHAKLEHGVPSIARRVESMRQLVDAGWSVGLRFDPLVYHQNYESEFSALLQQIFARIDPAEIHSVSLGNFRLSKSHFRKMSQLYPREPLFAQNLALNNGIISYPETQEEEMIGYCESELMKYISADVYHPCEWHD